MTKTKRSIYLLAVVIFFLLATGTSEVIAQGFSYTPMEEIPGFGTPSDFPGYLMAIYKFGLWAIGLSAMFMIMLGAFMYITSAGNNSQMGSAKGIITDAIAGLILALASFILLYEINPELVKAPTSPGSGSGKTDAQAQEECKKYWNAYYASDQGNPDLKKQIDNCSKVTAADVDAANKTQAQEECKKYWNDYYGGDQSNPDLKKQIDGCANVGGQQQNFGNAKCSNLSDSLNSELGNSSGVPPALLAAFMKRECPAAMTNPNACSKNNSYGAGGAMQFTDATWTDYKCAGSKFVRQDAINCAAKKIAKDSGGDYSDEGIRKAAKRYCGSCTDPKACGGDYCDGILGNYNVYKGQCST